MGLKETFNFDKIPPRDNKSDACNANDSIFQKCISYSLFEYFDVNVINTEYPF